MAHPIKTANRPDIPITINREYRGVRLEANGVYHNDNSVTIFVGSKVISKDITDIIDADLKFNSLEIASRHLFKAVGTRGKIQVWDFWENSDTGIKLGCYIFGNYRCIETDSAEEVINNFRIMDNHNDYFCVKLGYIYYNDCGVITYVHKNNIANTNIIESIQNYCGYITKDYAPYTLDNFIDDNFISIETLNKCENILRHSNCLGLVGPSGGGKTYLAKSLAKYFNYIDTDDFYMVVECNNIGDINNLWSKECKAKEFIDKAKNNIDKTFFIIFDELFMYPYPQAVFGSFWNYLGEGANYSGDIPNNIKIIFTSNEISGALTYNQCITAFRSRCRIVNIFPDLKSDRTMQVVTRFQPEIDVRVMQILAEINEILLRHRGYAKYAIGIRWCMSSSIPLQICYDKLIEDVIEAFYDGTFADGNYEIELEIRDYIKQLENILR